MGRASAVIIRTLRMHKVALFNGEFIDAADANIDALSAAALYGRGVFTTIAIYDGEPFLLDRHLNRLRSNSVTVGLKYHDEEFECLEKQLNELITRNSVSDCRARVTLFDGSASELWTNKREDRIHSLIVTGEQRQIPVELKLTISPFTVNSNSPLAGVKSCNYLENILAADEAKERGFDDAVRSNERGEIASACMANVFWLKGNELFTPVLETGCLAGTTREFVLENFDCHQVKIGLGELKSADFIFLTSAGIGIRQVTAFEKREFDRSDHEILKLLPPVDKKTRMSAK